MSATNVCFILLLVGSISLYWWVDHVSTKNVVIGLFSITLILFSVVGIFVSNESTLASEQENLRQLLGAPATMETVSSERYDRFTVTIEGKAQEVFCSTAKCYMAVPWTPIVTPVPAQ